MAGHPRIEIIGTEPWPGNAARLLGGGRRTRQLSLLIAPAAGSFAAVRERYPERDIVVLATEPSAVEAALLIYAGADAYLTDSGDLGSAVDSLSTGEAWLSPVAAAAICRLARLPGDPAMDRLAGLARAVAAGQSWPAVRRASGLSDTRSALARLRRLL